MSELQKLRIDRNKKASPRRGVPGGLGLWLVLILVLGGGYVFWPRIQSFVDQMRLPHVRTARAERPHPASAGAVQGKSANGYIVASRRAALSADTPGRIVELNVIEGSVVKKGDVVARLYSKEYEAAKTRAEAEILVALASSERAKADLEASKLDRIRIEKNEEAARADVSEAEAAQAHASAELDRVTGLARQGISTKQELDLRKKERDETAARLRSFTARLLAATSSVATAEQQVFVAAAELQVANARVESARAQRDQASATLEKTEVRAPFDGIVVLKNAEVGEVVSPNSQGGSTARGSVCTMVDFASLEVQADVPETSLSAVADGGPARIFLDAFPDRPYAGAVSRIWPTANRQKATVEVRIRFDKPDKYLRPEMGVRVVFLEKKASSETTPTPDHQDILVPAEAVVRINGEDGVFVIERDRVSFRAAKFGEQRGGRVPVETGLAEGEAVVVAPPAYLQNNDRVRVQED